MRDITPEVHGDRETTDAEAEYRATAEADPLIDTTSSASRQHYIETGRYLTVAEG